MISRTLRAMALVGFLASLVVIGVVNFALAHEDEGPHERLFPNRWYQRVTGGDYATWMTLKVSPALYECDGSESACATKWSVPFDLAFADWNDQPTTIEYDIQAEEDLTDDVFILVDDLIADMPLLLGISLSLDENLDLCPLDDGACVIRYEIIGLGDDVHTGAYGTAAARKATIGHELGHGLALGHQSANADSSEHFPCGEDENGDPIPHSIMAYNCIDPVSVGGLGETYVHDWDVCGVNHAYHDPNIGYALCAGGEAPPTSTPGGPTATPGPSPTPTATPIVFLGDADCSGIVDALDALFVLQFKVGFELLSCATNADVNKDGVVDSRDAYMILQFISALIDSLPHP